MKKIIYSLLLIISSLLSEDTIKIIGDKNLTEVYEIECVDLERNGTPSASLENNGTTLALDVSNNLSTAIYIMVDTSKSMGKSYPKGIREFLQETIPRLEKAGADVTLSVFSKNMTEVYQAHEQNISKVLAEIKTIGLNTELYRNTKVGLEKLDKKSVRRKILILISDGDAEDTAAYTIQDVIKYAKTHDIRIVTMGYQDKGTKLQNLRKISEDTYGKLWIADKKTHKMMAEFYDEFMRMIKSQFVINIPKHILIPNVTGMQTIDVNLSLDNKIKMISLKLPTEKLTAEKETFFEKYKLYLLLAGSLLLLLLLLLIFRTKEEEIEEKYSPTIIKPDAIPVAFLEPMGGEKHPIYGFPTTIGKKETNDVVIEGRFISRNHAVIDFKDGVFSITDRDSANGTKINGEKLVGTMNIVPGDKIEFGPYKTVFVLNQEGEK